MAIERRQQRLPVVSGGGVSIVSLVGVAWRGEGMACTESVVRGGVSLVSCSGGVIIAVCNQRGVLRGVLLEGCY